MFLKVGLQRSNNRGVDDKQPSKPLCLILAIEDFQDDKSFVVIVVVNKNFPRRREIVLNPQGGQRCEELVSLKAFQGYPLPATCKEKRYKEVGMGRKVIFQTIGHAVADCLNCWMLSHYRGTSKRLLALRGYRQRCQEMVPLMAFRAFSLATYLIGGKAGDPLRLSENLRFFCPCLLLAAQTEAAGDGYVQITMIQNYS